MMTGSGPFGAVGMGGMFSVLKVRTEQRPGDYKDPGWYAHPQGTVAYEWKGALAEAPRPGPEPKTKTQVEVKVRKPAGGHGGH
jgi:manganese oxidase